MKETTLTIYFPTTWTFKQCLDWRMNDRFEWINFTWWEHSAMASLPDKF